MAQQGAGGVHHVAFRTPDEAQYHAWTQRLTELRVPNSGEIDRFYFRSLYFREPNGILFEIATDGPGFATDEPLATLGEKLALPPFLEPRRGGDRGGAEADRVGWIVNGVSSSYVAASYTLVIPGRAKHEPGIHRSAKLADQWIPGLRQVAHPGMTRVLSLETAIKHTFAFSRRVAPEVCWKLPALSNQRAQGMPGARCTRGLMCNG